MARKYAPWIALAYAIIGREDQAEEIMSCMRRARMGRALPVWATQKNTGAIITEGRGRRMKRLLVLVVLILVVTGAFGQSNFGTGQWLHDLWLADKEGLHWGRNKQRRYEINHVFRICACRGAVGLGSAMGSLFHHPLRKGKWRWSFENLENHAERWDRVAVVSVYQALVAIWPGPRRPWTSN